MQLNKRPKNAGVYPKTCYPVGIIGWESEPLARPAREMFVANLLRLLGERNMRPSALAKAVGVDPSAVTAWKNGGAVTLDNLQKIADAFGVPIRELLEDPLDPKTIGIDVDTALRVVAGALKQVKPRKD